MKTPIKDFYGRIIGWIEEDSQGNKIVKDFYGRIVSKYYKKQNITKDYYGRVIGRGDIAISALYNKKQ